MTAGGGPGGGAEVAEAKRRRHRSKKRDFLEPISTVPYLARTHLARHQMNMLREICDMKTLEAERHSEQLVLGTPPSVERRYSYGAPEPPRRRPLKVPARTMSAPWFEKSVSAKIGATFGQPESAIPKDLGFFPNGHREREGMVQRAIVQVEDQLSKMDGEFAVRLRQLAEESGPQFTWDRRGDLDTTEQRAQFFARSMGSIRDCGGARDGRFGRPFDHFYLHREAMARDRAVGNVR